MRALYIPRDSGWRNYLRRVPNNSVLYYPGLDGGGATIPDYSGNVNNGTIVGATWVRLPSGLWYLDYDGNDYVSVDDATSLDITDKVTLLCWAYITINSGRLEGLVTKTGNRAGVGGGYWIEFEDRGGAGTNENLVKLFISDGAAASATGLASNNITATGWHFCVGTYDKDLGGAEEMKVYIDGVSSRTGDYSNAMAANNNKVVIGANDNDAGGFANHILGRIALPRILNIALTAAQIADIYGEERLLIGV
ncbi:hypothetical protein LCGC14_0369530 [marine sediment metagenome]|uniref:LamG-like jellyroll fold domain-containing protein n=1 Tax=marine sediment metagenome TaxID=412755 RepID=A0A0F9TBA5_9ZZZZ